MSEYPNFVNFVKKTPEVNNPLFTQMMEKYKEKLSEFHHTMESELKRGVKWLHQFYIQGTEEMHFQSTPFMDFDFIDYMRDYLKAELKKIEGVRITWDIRICLDQEYEQLVLVRERPSSYYFWLSYRK